MPALPTLNVGASTSEAPIGPASVPADVGLGRLAESADRFGAGLQRLADAADQQAGEQKAATDAAAGTLSPQTQASVLGRAYNQVAKMRLGLDRQAAMANDFGEAAARYADQPDQLKPALDAIRLGYGKTGFPDLDTELDGQAAVLASHHMASAYQGLHGKLIQNARGNFLQVLSTGAQQLDQVASGATFDADGGKRVAGQLALNVQQLAKFGPATAFRIGDTDIPADPTRTGALSPEEIEAHFEASRSHAASTWVQSAQSSLPDGKAQQTFADDIRKRWSAGDPLLSGLKADDAERLFDQLDTAATKQTHDDKAELTQHSQTAEHLMEAWQWGSGDVDPKDFVDEAKASGDEGLLAKAQFYAANAQATKGVLKSVVARQLGLTGGQGGAGIEWTDATGHPIGGSSGGRGMSNNNPLNLTELPAGQQWEGQTGVDDRGRPAGHGFVQFDSLDSGMKAAAQNLVAKQSKHGLNTIAAIIGDPEHGWAPASDNNSPASYAAYVAKAAGVRPDQPIDLVHDQVLRQKVMAAMARYENGQGSVWAPPAGAQPGSVIYAAYANTKEGFTSDPLKYMQDKGLATVAPLVLDSATSADPAAVNGWAQALSSRWATAKTGSATYGVPTRMLFNADAAYYKDRMANDATYGPKLASAALNAVGPQGAREFLGELGQDNGPGALSLHIAALSLMNPKFVGGVLNGLQLKASGAKPDGTATDQARAAQLNQQQQKIAPAFRFAPNLLNVARQAADLAHLADNFSGQTETPEDLLNGGVGGMRVNGTQYGGVTPVNGQQTVLPYWMARDRAPDALRALGDDFAKHPMGPAYANGQPLSGADWASMQPMMMANGNYRLMNPKSGNWARRSNGQVFEFDFDRQRPFLKQTTTGIVGPMR